MRKGKFNEVTLKPSGINKMTLENNHDVSYGLTNHFSLATGLKATPNIGLMTEPNDNSINNQHLFVNTNKDKGRSWHNLYHRSLIWVNTNYPMERGQKCLSNIMEIQLTEEPSE